MLVTIWLSWMIRCQGCKSAYNIVPENASLNTQHAHQRPQSCHRTMRKTCEKEIELSAEGCWDIRGRQGEGGYSRIKSPSCWCTDAISGMLSEPLHVARSYTLLKVRSQAAMLMRDCRVPGIQKEANILSKSLATHVKDAQENQGRAEELFGVSQMSFRRRRISLRKASMASSHFLLYFF